MVAKSPMKLPRIVLRSAVALLALLGLAVSVWLATEARPTALMTSGAVVTLDAVTYGKEHRFVYGSLWRKLA